MSAPSNGNGIWTRIGLALIVPVAAALIGYGVLKSDVQHVSEDVQTVSKDVQTRAPREVVDAQYGALLREIQALRADISDLKRRP